MGGANGRADYILLGKQGPLCVLEAKKPELKKGNAKPVKIALKVPLKPATKIVETF